MVPGAHRLRIFPFEQAASGQCPQEPDADSSLDAVKRFGIKVRAFVKTYLPISLGVKNSVDHDAVKVHMRIEQ